MQPAEVPIFRVTVAYMVGVCSVCRGAKGATECAPIIDHSVGLLMLVIAAIFVDRVQDLSSQS